MCRERKEKVLRGGEAKVRKRKDGSEGKNQRCMHGEGKIQMFMFARYPTLALVVSSRGRGSSSSSSGEAGTDLELGEEVGFGLRVVTVRFRVEQGTDLEFGKDVGFG